MLHTTGGWAIGTPSSPRERIDPSSKRKPSTCICLTQNSRHSRMNFCTIGWLQFTVLPQPE